MNKQIEALEIIKAGAFATYKQAGVPEQLWQSLLNKQATKLAAEINAQNRRVKIAEMIRNSPRVKAASGK